MYFHEALARGLARQGVETIFGLLGDANLFIMDSFERHAGQTFVSMSHEAGAVMAACGYAHATGQVGVATVTCGPGITNTMTALVEGVRAHAPVVLLAGDTPLADREAHQNIAQREFFLATGAGFEQLRTPTTGLDDLANALRRAVTECRPIVLNMPGDFQWQQAEDEPIRQKYAPPQQVTPDPAALDAAVGIIATAARPVIVVGRGAIGPAAKSAILRLAERIGAPVATTLLAKDLFRGHPHNLGIFGTLSHEVTLEAIAHSDCVITFGAGLNPWTSADGSHLVGKRSVQIDIDHAAIGRWAAVDVGVVGDATAVADAIVGWLDEAGTQPTGFASRQLADRLAGIDDAPYTDLSTAEAIDLRTALRRIDRAFPAERTYVLDGGRNFFTAITAVHAPEPRAYIHTVNFGSIGMGMGHAIGAAFAAPQRPVLLVTGDGGFMHAGLTEFRTAVRYGLNLTVIVLNDSAYGAEHIQLKNRGIDPAISTFDWPDFGPVATALGGRGFTARNLAELDDALAKTSARGEAPLLIDVKIDPDKVGGAFH